MLLFTAGIFLITLLTFKEASSPKVEDVSSTKQITICLLLKLTPNFTITYFVKELLLMIWYFIYKNSLNQVKLMVRAINLTYL